jgi:DHA1 family bicyclomycin/chloramphenicol resistance-like MFS transporter
MSEKINYSRKELILLATVVLSFAAFCIETDIYTPSFPDMMQYFGTTESRIQDILTWNFVGLCVSGLFYGPLSDCFGRKPLLSGGLVLFALSSIACTYVNSIEQLIFWRFMQGVGGGAISGIASTMVFDVFPSKQSAQLITILNSFVTGMMACAPLLGSWLNLRFGWRINFIVVAVFAVLSLLFAVFLLTETQPADKRRPFEPGQILRDYRTLLTSVSFMANTIIWTTMFGLLMAFTSNLSLIFIEYLKVDPEYFGFYQASIMTAFFLASLAAAKLIGKYGMLVTKRIGNGLAGFGAIALIALGLGDAPWPLILTIAMSLISAGVAISGVVYFVDSMADFPEAKGTTNALSQSLRLLVSAGMVGISAALFNGSIKPISMMAAGSILLVGGLMWLVQKRSANGVKYTLS